MDTPPCLVYSHSQAGNRLEGLPLLEYCGARNMSLLLFDFPGCGKSQGEYVSLGWFESQDLGLVISEARKRFFLDVIILWGRSMGAVSSILHAERHQSEIKMMILDSPFSNLRDMLIQIGQSKVNMPSVLISIALSMISSSITERLGVNILDLEPGKIAERCNVPAMFIVAKEDEILPPKSVLDIYSRYVCPKKAIVHSFEGGHSSEREAYVIEQAFSMITDHITKIVYDQSMKTALIMAQKPNNRLSGLEDPFLRSARGNRHASPLVSLRSGREDHSSRKALSVRGNQLTSSFVLPSTPNLYAENVQSPPEFTNHVDENNIYSNRGPFNSNLARSTRNLHNEYGLAPHRLERRSGLESSVDLQMRGHPSSMTPLQPFDINHQPTSQYLTQPQPPQKIVVPNINSTVRTTAYDMIQNYQPPQQVDQRAFLSRNDSLPGLSQGFSNQKQPRRENLENSLLDCSFENSRVVSSIGRSKIGRLGVRASDRPAPAQLVPPGGPQSILHSQRRLNFNQNLARFN